jgi:hypothetical protein
VIVDRLFVAFKDHPLEFSILQPVGADSSHRTPFMPTMSQLFNLYAGASIKRAMQVTYILLQKGQPVQVRLFEAPFRDAAFDSATVILGLSGAPEVIGEIEQLVSKLCASRSDDNLHQYP